MVRCIRGAGGNKTDACRYDPYCCQPCDGRRLQPHESCKADLASHYRLDYIRCLCGVEWRCGPRFVSHFLTCFSTYPTHPGDKLNHVATIHLAQMLYLWPLFAFFSLPLILPRALSMVTTAVTLAMPRDKAAPTSSSSTGKTPWAKYGSSAIFLLITVVLSFLVVKYNTIIHPFTLADNRHYMFYVFRYTIRRAAWIPFALILPYTMSRWLLWKTLSGSSHNTNGTPAGNQAEAANKDSIVSTADASVRASWALIWLLATSLSLVTAPLVEPRYFIIPWVIWRLMVPAWRAPNQLQNDQGSRLFGLLLNHSFYLWFETTWFLAINAATMYIFLTRPYQWRNEEGDLLDEGRWQRFMW